MSPIRLRDPEAPASFERSACCGAEISWGRTRAGQTSPPEPIASCSACGGRCDTIQITEEENAG